MQSTEMKIHFMETVQENLFQDTLMGNAKTLDVQGNTAWESLCGNIFGQGGLTCQDSFFFDDLCSIAQETSVSAGAAVVWIDLSEVRTLFRLWREKFF